MAEGSSAVPIVDLGPLVRGGPDKQVTARAIDQACRGSGFFYVVGHGVDEALAARLDALCRAFFAQDLDRKMEIRMEKAARAWRGYFPVGGELTSGKPDLKEGIYFGAEHEDDHPRVRARVPLHGKNLFPDLPGFREAALAWMAEMTRLGHVILEGMALGLGLPASYFADRYTADPTILFRAFHYPPPEGGAEGWGVGEHTDYGLLTILRQDDAGGLQVKSGGRWIEAPPVPGSFVCNIGDMLDRMTGGLYRSTPHRVHNRSGRNRLSLPFFFDPGWDAEIQAIDTSRADGRADERWDRQNVHEFRGTYGQWLLGKVAKVFPELGQAAGVT
ncbi:2-oxoglutarate and iron-dependent oxygenase domain-containing protein [Polyangium sp. y55x31]|uniref:isopenicillin N synthase family dioxygenase n=1 Tax=Polyangium sp. y55x31 TaxID=3042688 RepID=UPI0024831794|nr:2-oxoglutarate and iron-dependent oxygenase domain-containing protein [Polyangium sp. y55x31]MDI1484779.1 2-oxoglutarate and iron-dependent oxygenase domain-containing protein [Polyangium sp. y55x31]